MQAGKQQLVKSGPYGIVAPAKPICDSYVEAQDAIEALSLVKPDYEMWSKQNIKSTGNLTDEAKRSVFEAYLLGWNTDVRVTMVSQDDVVYNHAWVEELGVLAMEKAEVEMRKAGVELELCDKQGELNTCRELNQILRDQVTGLRREHSQLIEERDTARSQRDEYYNQVESLLRVRDNLLGVGRPTAEFVDPSRPISQEVKDLAYTLDPECWVSYSGKAKRVKQQMEHRRQVCLAEADKRLREELL